MNEYDASGPTYQYRPRMIGADSAFHLGSHSLEWNVAGHRGSAAYPMIARVRLGFRPTNLGNRRFITEIWPRNGGRVEIASSSYRSLVAMDDQGPAYNQFITELHRRVANSGGGCSFEAGFPAWRWWPMAAVGVATGIALVYVALRTFASGDLTAALVIAAFIGLFGWQMVPLILRNRPRTYDPRHIPEDVLPRAG